MKLLFLTTLLTKESQRLVNAARSQHVELTHLTYDQISLDMPPLKQESALTQADAVLTRVDSTKAGQTSNQLREALLFYFPSWETKMLNGKTYKHFPNFTKLLQSVVLSQKGVPIPETEYRADYTELIFPKVLKALKGSNGQQVHYLQNQAEFDAAAKLYGNGQFLIQEPLPIGQDYRVIVLGGKVLGMHKKITTTGFVTNVSAGGRIEPAEIERRSEIAEIAVAATEALECEYAGVDVMYNAAGKPTILEVNRAAGFNDAQEEIWGIHLADEIISYLQRTR